jgi:hypothetical protein
MKRLEWWPQQTHQDKSPLNNRRRLRLGVDGAGQAAGD